MRVVTGMDLDDTLVPTIQHFGIFAKDTHNIVINSYQDMFDQAEYIKNNLGMILNDFMGQFYCSEYAQQMEPFEDCIEVLQLFKQEEVYCPILTARSKKYTDITTRFVEEKFQGLVPDTFLCGKDYSFGMQIRKYEKLGYLTERGDKVFLIDDSIEHLWACSSSSVRPIWLNRGDPIPEHIKSQVIPVESWENSDLIPVVKDLHEAAKFILESP